jgi:hypothetical protein
VSPFEKFATNAPSRLLSMIKGHSSFEFGLGALNFNPISTIFKGCKQNIVSAFF